MFRTNLKVDLRYIESRLSGGVQPPNIKPITYNVREETISLSGYAKELKSLKESLQRTVNNFSEKDGSKYRPDTQWSPEPASGSSPRPYICDAPRTQGGDNGESSDRVFAIQPKEDPELIKIWINEILPVLPGILSRGLGETYAASLVRRGPSCGDTIPCIQIESPRIPRQENRASIEKVVRKIWDANVPYMEIKFRFTQGSLKKLYDGPDVDTTDHRLHFNLNRPCLKPVMGASLGLVCSTQVSATLGGFVSIRGEEYILTSDHFVEKSLNSKADSDVVSLNPMTIVSPSRVDLALMIASLEQTERDFKAKKNSELQEHLGEGDIRASELDDLVAAPESLATMEKLGELKELLKQVKKPYEEFTLGVVIKRSNAPRIAADAQVLGSSYANLSSSLRSMDWAICKVDKSTGQNRHKYQSNADAKADNYIGIDESKRAHKGEIFQETCDIEPGADVYYVGQKSGHRTGTVSGVPVLTSIKTVISHEWPMLDSHGHPITLQSVQGDSGAWVIRNLDSKLMGQVNSYSTGQVLFTPIKDIFDDIKYKFDAEVSLPTIRQTSADADIPIHAPNPADPLCSEQINPTAMTYQWLLEERPSKSTLDTGVSTSTTPSKLPNEIPREIEDDIDNGFSISRRGSVSSLPSLTSSPASPVLTSPTTPPSFQAPNISDQQLDEIKAWAELSEPRVGFVEIIEDQEPPKASESKTLKNTDFKIAGDYFQKAAIEIFENSFAFSFQEKKWSGRSSTWPVSSPKKLTRAPRHIPSTPWSISSRSC